jgi:hypothetical protein
VLIPIELRLFLPDTWINDPTRLQHAGVREAFWVERSKPEIALAELQHVMHAGVSFGAPPQPSLSAIRRMLLDHLAHAVRLRCPICWTRFTPGSLIKMPK